MVRNLCAFTTLFAPGKSWDNVRSSAAPYTESRLTRSVSNERVGFPVVGHGRNLEGLRQIINNYDIQSTIIYNYDIQNTIPNLNTLKIFASTNHWRILNKNADKRHKNISTSKMHKIQGDF